MGVRGQHRRGSFIHDLQWPLHGILLCLCNNTLMGTQTQCLSEIYTEWVPSRHNLHGSLWHQASFWQQHRRFWCIPQILYPFAGRGEPEIRMKDRILFVSKCHLKSSQCSQLNNKSQRITVAPSFAHAFLFQSCSREKTESENHKKGM